MNARCLPLAFAAALLGACPDDGGTGVDPNLPFGATALVIVANPEPNDANTASVPDFASAAHVIGVSVNADPGGSATTNATGLAEVDGLVPGTLDLVFDGGPRLPFSLASAGDVYDLAVAYDGSQVGAYPGFPIHYPIGGNIIRIANGVDPTEPLSEDDSIVFFEGGEHVGDLLIKGSNVVLFGEGIAERSVVVDGNVEIRGGNVRIRGVTITGDLTVSGNNFGMAYTVVQGAAALNGQAISLLRNTFCKGATVPSSNAALFDNAGLPPFDTQGTSECP